MKAINSQIKRSLFPNSLSPELDLKNPYFSSHLITYIGNKRRLLTFLNKAFIDIQKKIGKDKLIVLDGFAGSGSVSRLLKAFAKELHVNDLEGYSLIVNKTYLANKSSFELEKLIKYIDWLNENKLKDDLPHNHFIEKNYAPKNDHKIKKGERVFFTNINAKIIDNIRHLINEIPEPYKTFCNASLITKASIHNNTSGIFKGFHKKDGIGHFGGKGENALERIRKEISLEVPIFSDFECPVFVYQEDTNKLVKDNKLPYFDLVYYDPPYNQHPYGSNYFMLNIIGKGKPEDIQDGVSGISKSWNKSSYNKRRIAEEAMNDLIKHTNAKYILISYNNEGIIPIEKFKTILSSYGSWSLFEQDYNAYRGSRNLKNRNLKVREMLWILEKTN